MNGVEIVSIDKKVISKQTTAHLKRLAFEEAAPYLRVVLGDGGLVHEGSDHIAVHLDGRQGRVLFIRKTNTRGAKMKLTTKLMGLISRSLMVMLFAVMMVSAVQASGPYMSADPENPGQPYVYPDHGFEPWSIYKRVVAADGSVTYVEYISQATDSDYDLSNLSCSDNDDIIRKTLLSGGVYAGSLRVNGQCGGSPANFVLGNLLNYMAENGSSMGYTWPPVRENSHIYVLLSL